MPASLTVKWNVQRKILEENLQSSERLSRRKEGDSTTHVTVRPGRHSPAGH